MEANSFLPEPRKKIVDYSCFFNQEGSILTSKLVLETIEDYLNGVDISLVVCYTLLPGTFNYITIRVPEDEIMIAIEKNLEILIENEEYEYCSLAVKLKEKYLEIKK